MNAKFISFTLLSATSSLTLANPVPSIYFLWLKVSEVYEDAMTYWGWTTHDAGVTALPVEYHNWSFTYENYDVCYGYNLAQSPAWDTFFTPVRNDLYTETFPYSAWVSGTWIVKRKLTEYTFTGVESFVWQFQAGITPPQNAVASRTAGLTLGDVVWKWENIQLGGS
jgi:hypothetical protein